MQQLPKPRCRDHLMSLASDKHCREKQQPYGYGVQMLLARWALKLAPLISGGRVRGL